VDIDGITKDFSYTLGDTCGTLGTEDFVKLNFSAYPNPTQDSWTIKTGDQVMYSIQIFDILGKNILSISTNKSEARIDGSNLSKGIYVAKIKTGKSLSSVRLVKQ
jgi:hypothetical protein